MPFISRRTFIKNTLAGLSAAYVSTALSGCNTSINFNNDVLDPASFEHGIASGDPLTNSVILWTRITPENESIKSVKIAWEIALDESFEQVIASDSGHAYASADYTLKVDVQNLAADSRYFYRFRSQNHQSVIGQTRTLPNGQAESLSMAVISCSNYPAGYFHVYQQVAKLAQQPNGLDIVLHLGDYIYEYAANGYATDTAEQLGRVPVPAGELISLTDYRTRYAQYKTDKDLQAAHANVPFILVWDDHEVANDSWTNGAENHNEDKGEGNYAVRKAAAMRAYFEWLPVRPINSDDLFEPTSIYRQFEWGNLVNLLMLDARHQGRDKALEMLDFVDTSTGAFDFTGLDQAINQPNRQLLGNEQLIWLEQKLQSSTATWQVLGQQVLMGKMYLPGAVATQQLSIPQYAEFAGLAQLAQRAQANDPTLTTEELAYLTANQAKLTEQVIALLKAPSVPYNLDSWDGYAAQREAVFNAAKSADANLVVLAGDTHNAWANELTDSSGAAVGVELATSSVSSPGLEYYLGVDASQYANTEAGLVALIDGLKYVNIADRGLLLVDITHEQLEANWLFVSSIQKPAFNLQTERSHQLIVKADKSNVFKSA